MPKGFGFVNKAAQETSNFGPSAWSGKTLFKIPDGEFEFVRFVEIDGEHVYSAYHHEIPVEGRKWGIDVPCIAQDEEGNATDDPCPGCEADLYKKFKGYTALIWRDGPVYKLDDKNKIVKDNTGDPVILERKDVLALWSSGPRLFENLGEIHDAYGGLGVRDFRIKRSGQSKDTKYTVTPADPDGGKEPLSAADKKLVKDAAWDLNEFIQAPSYENWQARLTGEYSSGGDGSSNGESSEEAEKAKVKNPFKRDKQTA